MRWQPLQRNRGVLLLKLKKIQLDRVNAATDQAQRSLVLAELAGGDPGIDQRFVVVIDPKPRAIGGLQDELVFAGFISLQGPMPLHREPIGSFQFRIGQPFAEIKIDLTIDPFDHFLAFVEAARIVIGSL